MLIAKGGREMTIEEVREMVKKMSWDELIIFAEIVARLSQQNKPQEQYPAGLEED